jgi:hypothetical protein
MKSASEVLTLEQSADGSTHAVSMDVAHQVIDDLGIYNDGRVVDHGAF